MRFIGLRRWTVKPKRLILARLKRAVAITALGWRLRLDVRKTGRFDKTIEKGPSSGLMDSRRYRMEPIPTDHADEQELIPTVASRYFVSSKSSRPINILRISDVPPPIS